jgi:hypothetical protein
MFMGKGSSLLATLALVIGLGVGSFVIYEHFILIPPTTPDAPPENQWFDTASGTYYVLSGNAWNTIAAIKFDFNVSSGQTVHFLLIGVINFDDSSTPSSYVEVKLKIAGIILFYPSIYVRRYNLDSTEGLRMSVSLQHYDTTMTSGNYSIEIVLRGDSTADSARDFSLFVQTFN